MVTVAQRKPVWQILFDTRNGGAVRPEPISPSSRTHQCNPAIDLSRTSARILYVRSLPAEILMTVYDPSRANYVSIILGLIDTLFRVSSSRS